MEKYKFGEIKENERQLTYDSKIVIDVLSGSRNEVEKIFYELDSHVLGDILEITKRIKTEKNNENDCQYFSNIPDDILLVIFGFLWSERKYIHTPKTNFSIRCFETIPVLPLVCKRWRKLFIKSELQRFKSFVESEKGAFIITVLLIHEFAWESNCIWYFCLKDFENDMSYKSKTDCSMMIQYKSNKSEDHRNTFFLAFGEAKKILEKIYGIPPPKTSKKLHAVLKMLNAIWECRGTNFLSIEYDCEKDGSIKNIDSASPLVKLLIETSQETIKNVYFDIHSDFKVSQRKPMRFLLKSLSETLSGTEFIKIAHDSTKKYNNAFRFW